MANQRPAPPSSKNESSPDAASAARTYYNSTDADTFYHTLWGGEDLHIGIYRSPSDAIATASRRTVERMAAIVGPITSSTKVLDMGAGYGGAARYLAKTYGCHVTCLNLSEVENERNRSKTMEQGLGHLVDVVEGSFEQVPLPDYTFDLVWSQDAFLHSGNRAAVVAEIDRVLIKEGGEVIFTDPMVAEDADLEGLKPILARLQLGSLGSLASYRRKFERREFRDMGFEEMTEQLVKSYSRVLKELEDREQELKGRISDEYVRNMKIGLGHWVDGGENGQLCWGIMHFRR
ncbi:hypothetical protein N7G274_007646 [Stereocaulon virgatum]|uniref:Methyltransferase type 11 domain-containing protein n=1 Tax=Stereocaulon virgatum TaxID=373712 RepID=A0ABR4A1G5_9LECA